MNAMYRRVVDPQHPDPTIIAEAATLLREGGLVAFPTETVYGLGAHALDPDAVARIYTAKGRPAWNPLIAHVASIEGARALTAAWPDSAQRLAHVFWPGPLTLVLPRAVTVPDIATAGLDGVALRIPAHPVALALLRAADIPISAPSANRFTQVSPTTAQHVIDSLGDRVDLVLDGGPSTVGIESTVCDLTGDTPVLLRPGMISRAQLEAVLGCPVRSSADAAVAAHGGGTAAQRSPGMADRHYAPNADVWLVDAAHRAEAIRALTDRRASGTHGTVGALLLEPDAWTGAAIDRPVVMPSDAAEYARRLYAALHAADAAGTTVLVIERPPAADDWLAVLDRLTRAAR